MTRRSPTGDRQPLVNSPFLRTWLRAHEMGIRSLLALGGTWITAGLLCWIGLPTTDGRAAPEDASLQVVGIIGIVVASSALSLHLRDRLAWLTELTARRAVTMRGSWYLALVTLDVLLSLCLTPLLPPGLTDSGGYLSSVLLWLGISLLSGVLLPSLATLIVPFALVIGVTAGIIPFAVNPGVNPHLTMPRMLVAGTALVIGGAVYARRGSAQDDR